MDAAAHRSKTYRFASTVPSGALALRNAASSQTVDGIGVNSIGSATNLTTDFCN